MALTIEQENAVSNEVADLRRKMLRTGIGCAPDHVLPGFVDYAATGRPMGGYCMAVVEGDLFQAFWRADPINCKAMHETVRWLTNVMPADAYGNADKVRKWSEGGGLRGLLQRKFEKQNAVVVNGEDLTSLEGWQATLRILQSEGNGNTGAAAECRREIRHLEDREVKLAEKAAGWSTTP